MVNKPTRISPSLTTPLLSPPGPFLAAHSLVPAVVLNHVGQLDDELALFILLAALKGVFLRGTAQERDVLFPIREANVYTFDRIKLDIGTGDIQFWGFPLKI